MSEPSNTGIPIFSKEIAISESAVDTFKLSDGSIRFTHKTNFKIPSEQHAQWPKFYSVVLDKKNKQIVSLEFRNIPNLSAINKVLSLFQAEYEYREVPHSDNQQILRIISNGIPVIAYLYNTYLGISREAADILESALSRMTEDMMDQTRPTWKQDISIIMASWSDPIDLDEELEEFSYDLDYRAVCAAERQVASEIEIYKDKYRKLNQEEKDLEFKQIILGLVGQYVEGLTREFDPEYIKNMPSYKKYENIERVFDTPDKCSQYLYQKNDSTKLFVEEMQASIEQELLKLFTPGVFEQIFSDKNMKHVKVAGTGVSAGFSLILNLLDKKFPILFSVVDITKVVVSGAYAVKESGVINQERKEINLHELSKSFSCKVTICSIDNFMNLNHESQAKLSDFYSQYIYNSLTKNPHQYPTESYLASNLLEEFSNQTYIEKLGLQKELSTRLETNNGNIITVQEYIGGYNQTACYIEVLHDLMGQDATTTPRGD